MWKFVEISICAIKTVGNETSNETCFVMEALVLGIPVVSGDYLALLEILEDKMTGIIAENLEQVILREISFVMKNKEVYNKLKQNCQ